MQEKSHRIRVIRQIGALQAIQPFNFGLFARDWTGRQVRQGKRGAIPADLCSILERLSVRGDAWLDTVGDFGR